MTRHGEQRPDIDAPKFNVKIYNPDAVAPGSWFVGPYQERVQRDPGGAWVGPHIYDAHGELVWSGVPQFGHWNAFDFRATNIGGEPMLSFVDRHDSGVLLDNTYEEQMRFRASAEGAEFNMHDFNTVQDSQSVLLLESIVKRADRNTSRLIGFDGECKIRYYGFEEVDVVTKKTTFSWSSEGHVDVSETYNTRPGVEGPCNGGYGFDYIHANSIDKFPDGDYLLNARNCNAMYKISKTDGRIVWRFGGARSDFNFDPRFQGQHHARVLSQNKTHTLISFLDNSYLPSNMNPLINDCSRAFVVSLRTDTTPMTAEVVQQFDHPHKAYAYGRGNVQTLPNGNTFVGWTDHSLHSEYDTAGNLILEAQLQADLKSYRSYKFPWTGYPADPPDVHAEALHVDSSETISTTIWVSWNGATEVDVWNFYQVRADGTWRRLLGSVYRQGFETKFVHEGFVAHVQVEALDRNGQSLGESDVYDTLRVNNVAEESSLPAHAKQPSHATSASAQEGEDLADEMAEPEDVAPLETPEVHDRPPATTGVQTAQPAASSSKPQTEPEHTSTYEPPSPMVLFIIGVLCAISTCLFCWLGGGRLMAFYQRRFGPLHASYTSLEEKSYSEIAFEDGDCEALLEDKRGPR